MAGIGHNQPQNKNIVAYEQGMRFHLGISTSNLMRSEPEFTRTKAEAKRRRKALQEAGYRVHIFEITPSGGLSAPVSR